MSQVLLGCMVFSLPAAGGHLDRPIASSRGKSKKSKKRHTIPARQPVKPQQIPPLHLSERQRPGDTLAVQKTIDFLEDKGGLLVLQHSTKDELVDNVVMMLGDKGPRGKDKNEHCIAELNLYGHGNWGVLQVGNGQSYIRAHSTLLAPGSYWGPDWRRAFLRIKDKFCRPGGSLKLMGCHVGAGPEGAQLVFDLSQYFGVRVKAPIDTLKPNEDYQGDWQEALPSMTVPPPARYPTGTRFERSGKHVTVLPR